MCSDHIVNYPASHNVTLNGGNREKFIIILRTIFSVKERLTTIKFTHTMKGKTREHFYIFLLVET
jgi:hypothetical protein